MAQEHVSGVTVVPLPTPSFYLLSCASYQCSTPATEAYPCVPKPHQVAVADISRRMWQEGCLDKTSCLPRRRQDKVSKMAARLTAAGGTRTRTSLSSHPLAASQDTQAVTILEM